MVKNPMKNYMFWIKLIGGIILIAFGIALIIPQGHTFGQKMIVGITGGVVFVYGIFRIVPLFKTLEHGWSKALTIIEVLVDLGVGVLLVLGGFDFAEEKSKLTTFLIGENGDTGYYRMFLGLVLYLRAVIYFVCSISFQEKSDWQQLLTHIICITLGTVMFCRPEINADTLCYILLALSLLCGVILTGEGGYSYFNYRNNFKKLSEAKKKEKEDKKEEGINDPKDDKVSVPLNDETPSDSTYAN